MHVVSVHVRVKRCVPRQIPLHFGPSLSWANPMAIVTEEVTTFHIILADRDGATIIFLPQLSPHVILHPPATVEELICWPEFLLVPGPFPPPLLFAWNKTTEFFLPLGVYCDIYRRGILPTMMGLVNLHIEVNCRMLTWLLSEAFRHTPSIRPQNRLLPSFVWP